MVAKGCERLALTSSFELVVSVVALNRNACQVSVDGVLFLQARRHFVKCTTLFEVLR